MTYKTKVQKKAERELRERHLLDDEHIRLVIDHAAMLDFVYLAAASKRSDGTYNNCREALQQKAQRVLETMGL